MTEDLRHVQHYRRADALRRIRTLFNPRSIAVIGASRHPYRASHHVVKGLLESGYKGAVYPVNPEAGELLGLRCYPDLGQVPEPIDMAFIAVPAALVEQAVRDCGARGVTVAVIYSSGFSESGEEGARLQAGVLRAAEDAGLRFIGPNCIGVSDSRSKVTYYSDVALEPGGMALISHSGSLCGSIMRMGHERGLRFSKAVSLGNRADLGTNDFFDFLIDDPDTTAICMYLESLDDLAGFVSLARRAAGNKPVLVWKAGRTGAGSKAASTHTAALATSHSVSRAAFRQGRVIECSGIDDLLDSMVMLQAAGSARGRRLGIVSAPGGVAVAAADACEESGLALAAYSPRTTEKLASFIPRFGSARNPIDLTTAVFFDLDLYVRAVDAVREDEGVDMVLVVAPAEVRPRDFAGLVREHFGGWAKPVAVSWTAPEGVYRVGTEVLAPAGIPLFPTPERAIRALSRLVWNDRPGPAGRAGAPCRVPVPVPVSATRGAAFLDEAQAHALLGQFGLPVAESHLVAGEGELTAAVSRVGLPVVLKAVSPDVPHKSDAGLVVLDITDAGAALDAYRSLVTRFGSRCPGARLSGILVQPMCRGDYELTIGANRLQNGEAVVMFGLGGVFVELLGDVTFGVCPVSREDAADMIATVKAAAVFDPRGGPRGRRPVDAGAVSDLIARVSELMEQRPDVLELDLNPVLAAGGELRIVDALVRVAR